MCITPYTEHQLIWQGIPITVRYCPSWLTSGPDLPVQHIELHSENRVPLPVTGTGYRSQFLSGSDPLAEYGNDPLAYVTAWLDHECETQNWSAERQLSLF